MSSFTHLAYHIVFSTKYRGRTIHNEFQPRLYEYLGGVIRSRKGHLIEIGGVEDHVHILANLSPKFAVSDVVRDIKANGSKWINDQSLCAGKFEWQKGYAAFAVSCSNVETVRNYLRNQREHHRIRTFQEEYVAMLNRHGIPFHPEYLFEGEVCS